jgi:hypothetical protein
LNSASRTLTIPSCSPSGPNKRTSVPVISRLIRVSFSAMLNLYIE